MATNTILFLCSIVIGIALLPVKTQENNCPLWYRGHGATGDCVCGNSLNGVIECNACNYTVSIRTCYCMTMDESNMKPVVASCLYTCDYLQQNYRNHTITNLIETNSTSDVDNKTCGRYNRQGVLCSKCAEDYGLPLYSYNISCVPCKDRWYNLVKYIAVVYLPLTVFVLIIIFFRFSANSGSMVVYVTVSQMMANRSVVSLYLLINRQSLYVRIFTGLYSLWNLDAFRAINSNVCLHPNLSRLHILMLDYLVALYPILLVILTYVIVYLHGKSQGFAYLCRPFYTCLHKIRIEWNIKHSLIEAFATLILLSFFKILHLTFEALAYIRYYDMNYNSSSLLVRVDPSLKYLRQEHLPAFIIAIFMSFLFNFLPFLLLCVYPYSCTHRFLNYTGLNSAALRTLMDAFQGCYKIQPRFLQSFPVVFLLATFFSLLIYFGLDNSLYHTGISYVLIGLVLLLVLFAPYKNKTHNVINILLIVFIFWGNNSVVVVLESEIIHPIEKNYWVPFNIFVMNISLLSLPFYGLFHFFNYAIPRKIKNSLKFAVTKALSHFTIWKKESDMESLPYRCESEDAFPSNLNYH